MNELLKKGQVVSIVPQDFRNSNKGSITEINENNFKIKVVHPPIGILLNNTIEFYSQTPNGVLYFKTEVTNVEGNTLLVSSPIKHRFLQRRAFTRIKFIRDLNLRYDSRDYLVSTMDLSAGGMKFSTKNSLSLDNAYDIHLQLSSLQSVNCKYEPVRIEKNEEGTFVSSGRFLGLSNMDRMALAQFCTKKNLENTIS